MDQGVPDGTHQLEFIPTNLACRMCGAEMTMKQWRVFFSDNVILTSNSHGTWYFACGCDPDHEFGIYLEIYDS